MFRNPGVVKRSDFLYNFTCMSYLDVISVQQARDWLSAVEDDGLDRLIKAAIDWVENYTSYRLYQRTETIPNSKCEQSIAWYPINVTSVTYQDASMAKYEKYVLPTKLKIKCPWNSIITLQTGYANPADIPGPLVEACYKLITYLYENRDTYQATLPTDVQMLINQYRRALI